MTAFVSRMAWRETRAAWRHFAYFFVCIALGVAALVGVDLFAANLERAIQREARSLMAADVELRTTRPLTSEAQAILRRLDGRGIARIQVSELVAMAAVPSGTQLVELKAVEPGYPFYGKLRADPENALATLFAGAHALADAIETRRGRMNRASPPNAEVVDVHVLSRCAFAPIHVDDLTGA